MEVVTVTSSGSTTPVTPPAPASVGVERGDEGTAAEVVLPQSVAPTAEGVLTRCDSGSGSSVWSFAYSEADRTHSAPVSGAPVSSAPVAPAALSGPHISTSSSVTVVTSDKLSSAGAAAESIEYYTPAWL